MKVLLYKKVADFALDSMPVRLKHLLLSFRRFHLFKGHTYPKRKLLIQLVDGREMHGGLADRLKGMISAYCIADLKGYGFRILHTSPFKLEDYLVPNEYDWMLGPSDKVSSNLFETRVFHINEVAIVEHPGILDKLPAAKQLQCYCKGETFKYLRDKEGNPYDWGVLFKKLFRPSPALQERIDVCKQIIGGPYITVVFRFQNLLGDFPEYSYKETSVLRKKQLIALCRKELEKVKVKYPGYKILTTSDSIHFLRAVDGIDGLFSFPSKVVHLDTVKNADYDTYGKSFVDFYLIVGSVKVISAGTREMYKTNFPNYAAKVNKVPFERIEIEG